jgi:ribosomal protein S27E
MKVEQFTIRIKPYDGESLSSFLLRADEKNRVDYRAIIDILNRDVYISMRKKYIDRLDRLPNRVIDINKLSILLGISVKHLESLSFTPIYRYFLDKKDFDTSYRSVGLEKLLEKNHRRFCPQCIKETGFYKLIWQVKEIHTCNIHNISLTSRCQYCNDKQPYVWEQMTSFRCNYCNNSLVKNTAKQAKISEIEIRKYYDWMYFAEYKNLHLNRIEGLNRQQSLAILFLHTLNGGGDYLDIQFVIRSASKNLVDGLIRLIKGKERPIYVTLPRLFEILSKINLTIRDFVNQKPSYEFVNSLFSIHKKRELGPCLTPWCTSYNKNRTMKKVENPYYFRDRKKFLNASVCTDCYMKYGFTKEDGT